MRGRYERDDLLRLSKSPLVQKPASLPPQEEWMGPAEARPRGPTARGKPDEASNQAEGFQKRPTLFDSSRRSTTDPEKIHLGPPRNSFASSNARTRNGLHERTKTNDEEQKPADRRSAIFGDTSGRFGSRTESEYNGSERPRRRNEDEDLEGRPRRDHDRPRWGPKEGQSDQPWSRRDKREAIDEDSSRDSPAWRRGVRDRDHERHDAEPEWADAIVDPEPDKTHTHEDFVQFMKSMRNKKEGSEQAAQPESAQKEAAALIDRPPARVVSDPASVDKFFAKFEEQKKTMNDTPGVAKPVKSRFAALFGSKDEPAQEPHGASKILSPLPASKQPPPPPVELEQPAVKQPGQDKGVQEAAFANLLVMLGKNQKSSTPAPAELPSTKSPLNIAELSASRSPDPLTARSNEPQTTRTPILSHTPNLSIDRLVESRSPAHQTHRDSSAQAKATPQDLLDLLRRNTIQDKQAQQTHQHQQLESSYMQPREQRVPPPPPGLGGLQMRDQGPPLISTRRDNPRSIFDDPAFTGYRNQQDYQQRSPPPHEHRSNGNFDGVSGFFAAMNNQNYRQNEQQRAVSDQPINPPPGLARPPPGFDNRARPQPALEYPPQRQQYSPDDSRSAFTGQNRNAYQQPPQPLQNRQLPQRKPTNDMPIPPGFNIPPGFGPPSYASPTSPDTGMPYAMRGGYAGTDRERVERQQQQDYLARLGLGQGRAERGVQLPPGFR